MESVRLRTQKFERGIAPLLGLYGFECVDNRAGSPFRLDKFRYCGRFFPQKGFQFIGQFNRVKRWFCRKFSDLGG